LIASLTYLPNNLPMTQNCSPAGDFQCPGMTLSSYTAGASNVITKAATIYLNQINQPTEAFCTGMTDTSGKPLTDNVGNELTVFFALHAQSEIMLNEGDTAGDYQFAILSDDGAVMQIQPTGSSSYEVLAGSNGAPHSNTLECSASAIPLTPLVPMPILIDYYQGPANEISFVLLWRKTPGVTEPECGVEEGNSYFFNFSSPGSNSCVTSASTPNQPWTNVLNRGWSVVPAANFYLPNGQTNNCIMPTSTATPVVPVPVATAAAAQTVLTPTSGGSITDASGNVWTLTAEDDIDENGTAAPGGAGTSALTYVASTQTIWGQDATSGGWYSWNGSNWIGPAATSPVSTATAAVTFAATPAVVAATPEPTPAPTPTSWLHGWW
jgi:hypothetical protein